MENNHGSEIFGDHAIRGFGLDWWHTAQMTRNDGLCHRFSSYFRNGKFESLLNILLIMLIA